MSIFRPLVPLCVLVTPLAACDARDRGAPRDAAAADVVPTPAVNVADSGATGPYWADDALPPEELERGRLDPSWQRVVQLDTSGLAPVRSRERWEHITPTATNTAPSTLPLGGDVAGPSVLKVQVLLDRALFSPGMLDGHWGKNTAKAVYWLQKREGLRATGEVDSATFARLAELDVWIVPPRAQRATADPAPGEYGVTLRFYDERIGAWRSTWHGPVHGIVWPFIARQVGEEMVLERTDENGEMSRWIFSEITPESFHWRAETSTDQGRSWRLDQVMLARRR